MKVLKKLTVVESMRKLKVVLAITSKPAGSASNPLATTSKPAKMTKEDSLQKLDDRAEQSKK